MGALFIFYTTRNIGINFVSTNSDISIWINLGNDNPLYYWFNYHLCCWSIDFHHSSCYCISNSMVRNG